MAKDLLFEIGAEEIPAGFLPNIIKQLGELATDVHWQSVTFHMDL